jgi:hypothetical protein
MNLKKIMKEEINDFDWTEDVPAKLNTYRVTYRTELYISAHTEEEANEIYEELNLGDLGTALNYNEDEVGLKDYSWYETTSFERVDD